MANGHTGTPLLYEQTDTTENITFRLNPLAGGKNQMEWELIQKHQG